MFSFLDRAFSSMFGPRPPSTTPRPPAPPTSRATGPGGNPDAAAEVGAPFAEPHPTVQAVMDHNASDTPAEHEQRLAAAKTAVMAENSQRGQERQAEMVAEAGPTVVQNLVLGGGTLATLDAATLPRGEGEVMGVSMPSQADRPVPNATPGGPAAGTGQQRIDPWSTYGDFQIGQTGNQLLPFKMKADGTPELGPDGKPIPDPGLLGMAVQPAQLQQDPSQYARSSELSLATAETLRQSGVPMVPGQPVGAIQLAPQTDEERAAQGWPPEAKAMVEVQMIGADGKPLVVDGVAVTEKVFATETLDVCVGPGPGRKFGEDKGGRKGQVAPDDARRMEADGDVVYAEAYLGGQGNANQQNVLVFGGGDTGAWVCQTALGQQAVDGAQAGESVSWAARPMPSSRPPLLQKDADGKDVKTDFALLQERIKQQVDAGGAVDPADSAKYNELVANHQRSELDKKEGEIAALRANLARLPADARADEERKLAEAEQQLKDQKKAFNPFGEEKPRNEGTGDAVPQIAKDILRVTPTADGKVEVTFEDGSKHIFDKVVGSMGQDPDAQTGPKKLVGDIPLVPIMEGDPPMPVGLQSPDGAVRVMGASAWQVRGNIADETQRKAFEKALTTRAATEVSRDSRGVVFGFENMGDNPARANQVLAADRAEEAADELSRVAVRDAPPEVDGPGAA